MIGFAALGFARIKQKGGGSKNGPAPPAPSLLLEAHEQASLVLVAGVAIGLLVATYAVLAFAPSTQGAFAWVFAVRKRCRVQRKRVFCSGCFDLLHSGHVAFFREAAQLGNVYVSVGNDANVTALKKKPMFPEAERVYMVQAIRWVHTAFVAHGMGHDQGPDLDFVRPDIFFVNEDGDKDIKRQQCAQRGIEYVVAARTPDVGLEERSSTSIKATLNSKS